ncbi:T9SS type A sorting domain-containing protein [Flavobacterium sediminilitoris]|uniref:T9SS type A sorting domain-containing protein n=1 Tax=Flavobacterium sediminilitoris TaxID=2024526 RepID=A0ABY4HMB1_9FLAO|nr:MULTISPECIES: T9SS type A sorting domain-containing protein [Flavobacterium]UOX34002.1 T9SS type A sorting domain-containing protein [Flavobacterium sediminilitoris]
MGTAPNVVLGQSMGGVIARYALRDMENQQIDNPSVPSWNHQTSLYISHDAPHQGANIPLSVLYFARHLGDQFVGTPLGDMNINPQDGAPVTIEDIQALLNAPGTRQLLKNNIASNFEKDNNLTDSWQTELRNLGYPLQTRNIAISNGSHCANPQSFLPNATLFSLSGYGKTSFLTSFLTELLGPLNAINDIASIGLAILFNEPGLLLGVLPGNSKFSLDFSAKALPSAGTTAQIYKGKLVFTKKLFWAFNINVTLTDRSYNNPSGILSYDYYPGGKYPVPFNFQNSSVSNAFFSFGISAQIAPNFNFIPSPSALDIGKGNVALNNNDYFVKYNSLTPTAAPKDSPFVNFSTSFNNNGINENHISFNTRNGNWLATELDNVTTNSDIFDCTYMCSDSQISGLNLLCTTATYTAPEGGTFNSWTITQGSNLVTATGINTQNLTLTALPNASGQVTISLLKGDNNVRCGNLTLTKTIWVGKSMPHYTADRVEFCNFNYRAKDYPNTNSYSTFSWQYVSGSGGASSSNFYSNGDFAQFTACPPFTITMKLIATNACGTSEQLVDFWLDNDDEEISRNASPINTFSIYPNPSKDIVTIELRDKNNQTQKASKIYGELFDLMGISKSKVEIKDNKAIFSVNGLNKGIYVLKIFIDDAVENHQIAVE